MNVPPIHTAAPDLLAAASRTVEILTERGRAFALQPWELELLRINKAAVEKARGQK